MLVNENLAAVVVAAMFFVYLSFALWLAMRKRP